MPKNAGTGDCAHRLDFSRWVLHKQVDYPNFLKNVLFTDETTFSREGVCIKQSCMGPRKPECNN